MENYLDDKGIGRAVLMDWSKAIRTLNHEPLIIKLHAYGFNRDLLNKSFSSWTELIQGVPQGTILGPLLFNIYLNHLFYLPKSTEVCSFADDTTFFACDKDLKI